MDFIIEPLDTLFFRDGTPFNAGETQFLDSVFPPTPRTIQGFLRSAILESVYDNWGDYYEDCKDGKDSRSSYRKEGDVVKLIGDSESLGKLQIGSPYLIINGARLYQHLSTDPKFEWYFRDKDPETSDPDRFGFLKDNGDTAFYPAPLDLLYKISKDKRNICKVERYKVKEGKLSDLGKDLGKVAFPYFEEGEGKNIKDYSSGGWISATSLEAYLQGDESKENLQILTHDMLYVEEPRVGIARNNESRAVEDGHLYSINQIRLRPGVTIGFSAEFSDGSDDELLKKAVGVRKFGGEGKLVKLTTSGSKYNIAKAKISSKYFRLVFLSLVDFNGGWLPPSAKEIKDNGITYWQVECGCLDNKVTFKFISASMAKSVGVGARLIEGDVNKDKRVRTCIRRCVPAGSVYYCEAIDGFDPSVLNNCNLGVNRNMGFGKVVIGEWEGVK